MNIERLDHLVLTVADIDRTCDFYTRVLGMEVVHLAKAAPRCDSASRRSTCIRPTKSLASSPTSRRQARAISASSPTAPLAEVAAHLENCGVPIVAGPGPRAGAIGTIQSVYIRDPDQNLILSANSGDRCQSGEAGHACFGPRRSI